MGKKEQMVTVSFRLSRSDRQRIAALTEQLPLAGNRTTVAREALRIGLGYLENLIAKAGNNPVKILRSIADVYNLNNPRNRKPPAPRS